MGVIASSIATVQTANVLGSAGLAQTKKNKESETTNQAENQEAKAETRTGNSASTARIATATANNTKFPTSPYPPTSSTNNSPIPPMTGAAGAAASMGSLGQGAAALAGMKRGGGQGGGGSGGSCNGGGQGQGNGNGGPGPNVPNNPPVDWGKFNAVDRTKTIDQYGINTSQIKNIQETENKGVPVREINSEADLQKITSNGLPTIVKIGATWCGPCKQLDENLPGIYKDLKGKANIATIDVDKNPELAKKYMQGGSVPQTLVIGANGMQIGNNIQGNDPTAITKRAQDAITRNEANLQNQIQTNSSKTQTSPNPSEKPITPIALQDSANDELKKEISQRTVIPPPEPNPVD